MNQSSPKLNTTQTKPRGTVLIVVIWIVLILASLVIVMAHATRVEAVAAMNHIAQVKAEAVANGAIQYILAKLSSEDDSTVSYGSDPYEAMEVGDGYFWVLGRDLSGSEDYTYGLVDEAGKINLNSASPEDLLEMLLKLPNMTTELATSIIDWQDEDDDVTSGGAESEYYLLLSEPYQCKNAPLETVEEVLLIKGGDRDLLYGEDTNRNGVLDWNENDGEQSSPADNSNGSLDRGFFDYVTIHSYETNTNGQGQPRLDLNDSQNQAAFQELLEGVISDEQAITVLQTLRNAGLFSGRQTPNRSLIGVYYISGMAFEDYEQIIDRITVDGDAEIIAGRININAAPQEVLLCLPGLEESDVDALVQKRSQSDDLEGILWITQVLDEEKARAIGSYITSKSSQYSADIVAVSGDGRAFARYYVVIDTAAGSPEIIYKQSLHYAGWPLEEEILEKLRDGQTL